MVIILLVIGLFLGLGVVLFNGKGSFLIAGFNTMPSEEKEKYDVIALCKFVGKMMFALAFSMFFWFLSEAYDSQLLFYIGLILFLALVAFMLIFINTRDRFKK
ncbi:DUF3784 domain-containing protein [Sporosarcina oncorhynchi]|uniref:DUF3784 domain-containing protein n=1 Tax=Sporosarcina oncorhynchi TaxID=3056444 RepID=A0ABZ0L8C3_9BACL|nr:DUF3784 domain-containing protein [Sporosarcina sp. T2O-4]WOV87897.1 DUF3784 domain-containing protein [Sporosarcina sp. T2O-4]